MVTRTLSMQISENLSALYGRIAVTLPKTTKTTFCNLVAVSKTKPIEDLQAAYEAGQRRFGENYVDEFVSKVPLMPYADLEWHFIGHIQSNKIKKLLSVLTPEI